MKLPRRNFFHLAAGAAALPAVSRIAWAQAYPTRPVRLIVPFGPAGAMDITARLIGQWLSERLGQQFVIENRPGAGGNVGTEAVVRAAPDGYTLGLFGAASAINATLYDKLNFNFVRDIAPVAPIVRFPYIMVLNPSVPAKTLPEFIAYAKDNPGKINMASPGIGSSPHVNGELFKVMTGTNLVHVPYRSAAAVMTDLLSPLVPAAVPHLRGDLRTSAPGAYLPAVSASGTCAHRRAARAARRPDLMDQPSLQTLQPLGCRAKHYNVCAPPMPAVRVFHRGRTDVSSGRKLAGLRMPQRAVVDPNHFRNKSRD
jgi:tripartite-type tricarboxylate transporter receptor subunit TctC